VNAVEISFLSTAFEDAPFQFWVRDAGGRLIFQNAAARDWGEHIGARVSESHMPPAVVAAWNDNNRRASAGEVVQNEVDYVLGGQRRHFQVIVVPVRVDGRIENILGFNIDITDRKRAEEALRENERRLRETLRVGRMGYIDWDLVTNDVQWSLETYRMLGYEPGAFTPTFETTVGMVPAEERARIRARLEAAFRGECEYDVYHRMVRPDGKVIHVHGQAAVRRDEQGKPLRMLGTLIDITERRVAEEALGESDRRLHEALRAGRIGCIDWDLVTNEVRWSPELYQIYGHEPRADFTPTIETTQAMVHPLDLALVQSRLDAALRGTSDYEVDHRVVRPDGEVIYVHATGVVTRDAQGKPLHLFGTTIDVTERRVAEDALRVSEEALRQTLKAASAGTWEWDIPTGKLSWSRETYAMHGVDPEGKPPTFTDWQACVHPDDRDRITAAVQDALAGRVAEYRVEFRVPDGERGVKWVLGMGQVKRAPDGAPLRMMGICLDITSRKQAEEDLREVDQRRRDFLGVLSHELRNPLTPILSSLYLLDRAELGGEPARRALAVINRQVTHLVRLVDDLLDMTRISSGKIRLQSESLDLTDLVRRTIDDHRTLFTGHEVDVDLPQDVVWIRGDAIRLAQVIGNVLNNAAKFTPENGKVSVSLGRADGRAVLEVEDTGLGLDPETLARIFMPFAQGDRSLDRSRGGLGLGLALVKSLVEMHGGDVSARSDGAGRGACFTIRLPLDEPVAQAPRKPPEKPNHGRKVLVIEDNKDAAETLATVLGLLGHEVTVAFDGEAGLAKAREFHPEVILCDLGLPGALDGYAVARALRQDPGLAAAYRVALSGYAQPEDQRKSREAGFAVHMAKPPDVGALDRLIAEAPAVSVPRLRSLPLSHPGDP
jgi:PAS domain S-box-containing protein